MEAMDSFASKITDKVKNGRPVQTFRQAGGHIFLVELQLHVDLIVCYITVVACTRSIVYKMPGSGYRFKETRVDIEAPLHQ